MNTFITFEVSDNDQLDCVIRELKEMGYFTSFISNSKTYSLPIGSAWKPETSLKTAMTDIKSAVKYIKNLHLTKCVIVPLIIWEAIPDTI